jgi:hypothetical protein
MKSILITLIILLVGSALGYAVYPLTQKIVVDDPLPSEVERLPDIVQAEIEDTVPDSVSMAHLTDTQKTDMMRSLIESNKQIIDSMSEEMPNATSSTLTDDSDTVFSIEHTPFHPASGIVRIVHSADGAIIRFEDYETINGPNLHVYLANDLNANDFVDLGEIRGTVGNINYMVPEGVVVSEYKYVLVWCVPFGVLFHFADLTY